MPVSWYDKKITRRAFIKSAGAAACGFGGLAYGLSSNSLCCFDVHDVSVPIKNLDRAFDGFRVTQISDLHCDDKYALERLAKAVELVNRRQSDLIVITGDYFTEEENMNALIDDCRSVLSGLKAPSGVIGVAGNHDYWVNHRRIRQMLDRSGINLLDNQTFAIKRKSASLNIVGLSSLWMRKMDIPKAFSEDGPYHVVLAHNPDTAPFVSSFSPGIMISGHTHGGQVRLPFFGPIINKTRIGRKYSTGLHIYRQMPMYTNRGIGTYLIDFRFLCPAEITTFTFIASSDTKLQSTCC